MNKVDLMAVMNEALERVFPNGAGTVEEHERINKVLDDAIKKGVGREIAAVWIRQECERIEQERNAVVVTAPLVDFILLREAFANPDYLKEPVWITRWLCQQERVTLFIGPPSAAKSWIACADVLEAVRNGKKVLYINVDESPADLIRRFKNFNEPRLKDAVMILNPEKMDLNWDIIYKAVDDFKPDAIYFDSWDKIIGLLNKELPQSHENWGWRAVIEKFMLLCRTKRVALCILIHTKKSDPKSFSGNQQIMAAVDISIIVSEAGKLLRKLEYGKRVVREPVMLEWQKDTDGSQREVDSKDTYERRFLLRTMIPDKNYTRQDLIKMADDEGISRDKIDKAWKSLVKDGKLKENRGNKNRVVLYLPKADLKNKLMSAFVNQPKNSLDDKGKNLP